MPPLLFRNTLCVVRGGGDLATGVVHRLHHAGFPVVVLELDQPRVVRRMVSVAQAIYDGAITIDRLNALHYDSFAAAVIARSGDIPVVTDPDGDSLSTLQSPILIDARMCKQPLDTKIDSAQFVVGLGPGFVAGVHCHAVIETNRGHDLGRVIWKGAAQADTGKPESVMGFEGDRVLRAPTAGVLRAQKEIGDLVRKDEVIATVDGQKIIAPFDGALRGLIHDGIVVTADEKVGDLDPRCEPRYCFTISDKSLAIGGGVVEAVLSSGVLRGV
jgi:xanthine dehydrogenase accessory factor